MEVVLTFRTPKSVLGTLYVHKSHFELAVQKEWKKCLQK